MTGSSIVYCIGFYDVSYLWPQIHMHACWIFFLVTFQQYAWLRIINNTINNNKVNLLHFYVLSTSRTMYLQNSTARWLHFGRNLRPGFMLSIIYLTNSSYGFLPLIKYSTFYYRTIRAYAQPVVVYVAMFYTVNDSRHHVDSVQLSSCSKQNPRI